MWPHLHYNIRSIIWEWPGHRNENAQWLKMRIGSESSRWELKVHAFGQPDHSLRSVLLLYQEYLSCIHSFSLLLNSDCLMDPTDIIGMQKSLTNQDAIYRSVRGKHYPRTKASLLVSWYDDTKLSETLWECVLSTLYTVQPISSPMQWERLWAVCSGVRVCRMGVAPPHSGLNWGVTPYKWI